MNSRQYGCLNKNGIMTIAVDMSVWMGVIPQVLPLDEELQVTRGSERRGQQSPGMSPHEGCPIPSDQLWVYIHIGTAQRAIKTTQRKKALIARPDDLNSTPRTHMVEGGN